MIKLSITSYKPQRSDKFFFDNNIWMYLYCPIGNYKEEIVSQYSNFFGKVLDAGSTIYVSSLTLSEFYNAYLRLDFNIWRCDEKKDFKKDFRPTEQFKKTNETILRSIESRILGISRRVDDDFTSLPVSKLIERIGILDFNDNYYTELALKHSFKIVTNDRDFEQVKDNITILSLY